MPNRINNRIPPLSETEADDLRRLIIADCVNTILDMRDRGANAADMMTVLTRVNIAVTAYVMVSAETTSTPGGVVRAMAKTVKDHLPAVIAQYRVELEKGKTL